MWTADGASADIYRVGAEGRATSWIRRQPRWAIAAGAAFLVLVGGVVLFRTVSGADALSCAHPASPVQGVTTSNCISSYNNGYNSLSSMGNSSPQTDEQEADAECTQTYNSYVNWQTQAPDGDAWVDGCVDADMGKPSTPRDN